MRRNKKIILDSPSLDECVDKELTIHYLNSRTNKVLELKNHDFIDDIISEYDSHSRKTSFYGGSHGIYCGQFYDDELPFPDDSYYESYYDDYYEGTKSKSKKKNHKSRREKLLSDFFPNLGKRNTKRNKRKGKSNEVVFNENAEKWIYFYEDYEDMSNAKHFSNFKEFKEYLDENGINLSEIEEKMIKHWDVVHATFNPTDKANGILTVVSDTSQGRLYETCADIEYSYQVNKSDLPF